jgi:EAL domain-containing protein (putative c-di-GMP-specific phosphodiesterase class I)
MGVVSPAREGALALEAPIRATLWRDASGIRGVIRHELAGEASIILMGVAIAGAVSGGSHQWLFGLLALGALGHFVARPVLARLSLVVTPEFDFRIAVFGWPIALLALGWVAWDSDQDLGAVVAVAGFVLAVLVAIAESTLVAVGWTAVASAAVVIGAALAGTFVFESLIAAAAISGGTLTGYRVQHSLEAFLDARGRLMRDVSRIPADDDPFVTAKLLVASLGRWTPLRSPSIIWFRPHGGSVFLALHGDNLPPRLAPHVDLPATRDGVLRARAADGPWIDGWAVRSDDAGYSGDIASLGITAIAYAPLVFEGSAIGVVAAGMSDRADERSVVAEYVPTLVQFADAAAVALGPSLAAAADAGAAHAAITGILEQGSYWPVFQPVRRLIDGQIVGYEALSRFQMGADPSWVFAQARIAGRMRELELATLCAAATTAASLPRDCWLSLNCSPDLLVDTRALAEVLAPIHQHVVLELSEHDPIPDYAPITAAVAQIRPQVRLAVDDAGAGFASLRHVLEIRPGLVKLDITLVQGVATDLTRAALVAGFVHFAAEAKFDLIAEGIETEADEEALRRLGVAYGQGFLLGRPEPVHLVARNPDRPPRGPEAARPVRSRGDRRTNPATEIASPLAV